LSDEFHTEYRELPAFHGLHERDRRRAAHAGGLLRAARQLSDRRGSPPFPWRHGYPRLSGRRPTPATTSSCMRWDRTSPTSSVPQWRPGYCRRCSASLLLLLRDRIAATETLCGRSRTRWPFEGRTRPSDASRSRRSRGIDRKVPPPGSAAGVDRTRRPLIAPGLPFRELCAAAGPPHRTGAGAHVQRLRAARK